MESFLRPKSKVALPRMCPEPEPVHVQLLTSTTLLGEPPAFIQGCFPFLLAQGTELGSAGV